MRCTRPKMTLAASIHNSTVIRDFSPNETELSHWQWSARQLHSQLSSEDSQLYSAHRQHARSVCPPVAGEYFRTWLERLAGLLQLKIEMMVVQATRIESRAALGARILAVQILGN
jgi:hypothetical protein